MERSGTNIFAHGNKKYLLEIKESLLIKCNQPVLNKNGLMSLISFYCDNCSFYNLLRC